MPEDNDNEEVGLVVRGIQPDEARVNVTWNNQNGDMVNPVHLDVTDGDVKQMVAEAISGGGIPGIDADAQVDLTNFVVTRFDAKEDLPNRMVVRPKVPFGPPFEHYKDALDKPRPPCPLCVIEGRV